MNRTKNSCSEDSCIANMHGVLIMLRKLPKALLLTLFVVIMLQPYSSTQLPTVVISSVPLNRGHSISADTPKLNLTYYSNWNSTKVPVHSNQKIEGDHITLNATFYPKGLVNRTRIEVNLTAINNVIFNEANASTIEIDTRSLGNNGTCLINVTAWLANGSIIINTFENVFLGNFFKPHVSIITPKSDDVWTGRNNITWLAWDNNTEETLTFEVLLSSDGGYTFNLLAAGLTEMWYEWDCSEFIRKNDYIIEVRVSDGIYTSYDKSPEFTAGDIIPTTPTTETTTTMTLTNTTGATTDVRPALFISASIIISAFFAVLVYYIAKK